MLKGIWSLQWKNMKRTWQTSYARHLQITTVKTLYTLSNILFVQCTSTYTFWIMGICLNFVCFSHSTEHSSCSRDSVQPIRYWYANELCVGTRWCLNSHCQVVYLEVISDCIHEVLDMLSWNQLHCIMQHHLASLIGWYKCQATPEQHLSNHWWIKNFSFALKIVSPTTAATTTTKNTTILVNLPLL